MMKKIALSYFVFLSLGYGQVFRTASLTNFCKYISTDTTENLFAAIDARTPEKAILVDFDAGDTTAYDISWMMQPYFSGAFSGSSLFIFTKGMVAGDSDVYLILASPGPGSGSGVQSYSKLFIINFRTRQKVFDSELNNYSDFKSAELRFSKTGTYLVAIAGAFDYFSWDHTLFFKLNSLDLTNVFLDHKKAISLFGP